MNRTWIAIPLALFLAACGEEQKPYQAPLPHSSDKAAAPFQPQREALDAAKGLGQAVEQGAKAREEAAEKALK